MSSTIDTVAVIGLGYIGLPTAAVLATNGLNVVGVDVNEAAVDAVNAGTVPFVEPDLEVAVAGAVTRGRLRATTKTPAADAYIVAVPTPFMEDKSADLSYIRAAMDEIAPQLSGGELVILESTSPPGTTQQLADHMVNLRPDLSYDGAAGKRQVLVAHCPERVLPGKVMIELVTNGRTVGGLTPRAASVAAELYGVFCQGRIQQTNATTAELTKLVENAYRDVNIAFANELSMISDGLGVDVWELIDLANDHPRVDILQPGPGVGGHCIAVDPWFIVAADEEHSQLIRTARGVNDHKPDFVVDQVLGEIDGLTSPTVAALGLAFKANIDDLRESPAVYIVTQLAARAPHARIVVSAPYRNNVPTALSELNNVEFATAESAIESADVVALLVGHDRYRDIDKDMLRGKRVIDTRGFWRPTEQQ